MYIYIYIYIYNKTFIYIYLFKSYASVYSKALQVWKKPTYRSITFK